MPGQPLPGHHRDHLAKGWGEFLRYGGPKVRDRQAVQAVHERHPSSVSAGVQREGQDQHGDFIVGM